MSTEREKTIFGLRLQELMDERSLSNERLGDICGDKERLKDRHCATCALPKLVELL